MTSTNLKRLSEAETLLIDSWEAQKKVLEDEHPETSTTTSRIAKLYERQGRRKEAADLYHETVEASIRASGADHPRAVACLRNLDRFETVRRSSEATVNLHPARVLRTISVDLQHPDLVEERED